MKKHAFSIPRALVFIIGLLIIIGLTRSLIDLWQRRGIIVERKQALEKVVEENTRLKKEIEESQTPEFIEKQAREKLGFAKPDEIIVLATKATSSGTFRQEEDGMDIKPSWRLWWELFF